MKTWSEEETAWDQGIGERLCLMRRVLGISEREAADAAGVTIRTYRKWEKGGHARDGNALDNLCYELGVSVVWLLDNWGSFLDDDDLEFEDMDELRAWSWRQRMRRRSADGSLEASCLF
jgi:transcriptional regulator with XRE-family HTH domain